MAPTPSPVRSPLRVPSVTPAEAANQAYLVLTPPYDRVAYATRLDSSRPGWAAGTLVGLRLERTVPDWSALEQAVRRLRARMPAAPVVLLVDLPPEASLLVSAVAARMHVRAVLSEGPGMQESLRSSLTESTGLADGVIEWLELVGVRLSPATTPLIHRIVALAPEYPDLRHLLRAIGTPESTARFRFHKRLLPAPSKWFQVARALYAALRLQAQVDVGLLPLAHEMGYNDHSALSQLIYRSFGLRPSAIRGTLGWEWLLDRWIGRYPRCRRPRWA
jgi:hypothetical protein